MNHQPYETWILDEVPLSEEQKAQLDDHLQDCQACRNLAFSWTRVHETIKAAPLIDAPVNFTRNWQSQLATRKREQEKKQARTLVMALTGSSVAILATLAGFLLPAFSPISTVVLLISASVQFLNGINGFWSVVLKLTTALQPSTLIGVGIFISGWVLMACLAWGLSIWKYSYKRGYSK